MTEDDVLEYLGSKFDNTQMEFWKMQMQNSIEEHKRTFSTAQLDFSLALQREDPVNYPSIRNIFVLPDEATLEKYSNSKS